MNPSDVEEEMEIVGTMFDGSEVHDHSIRVPLDRNFSVQVTFPRVGYPSMARPSITVTSAPNVVLGSRLERAILYRLVNEEVALGGPMLLAYISIAQEELQSIAGDVHHGASSRQTVEAEEGGVWADTASTSTGSIQLYQGVPLCDRKSKFLAHGAFVRSAEDVRRVVSALRDVKHIQSAAHPAIYAYRFTDQNGVVHQDCDDDGETGASKKILFLLEQHRSDDPRLLKHFFQLLFWPCEEERAA